MHPKNENGRWTLEGVEPCEVTFINMCEMIRDGVNFKFARYGDGEFNAMFGKKGQNCDGHSYFPDLGQSLLRSFSKKAITGVQPLALTLYPEKIYPLIDGLNIVNADVLHNASIDGILDMLFDHIHTPMVCVGATHLVRLFDQVILIPDKNCWLQYENIKTNLSEWIAENKNGIIFLCASMMSEVLIKDFEDAEVTIIDAGSVFDPYVGVKSRRYHHKLKI